MHRKLAFALDERPVYWDINALRMGFKDGVLTPLWNMHVGIIYKTLTQGEHSYISKAIIKIFYTDLESGKLLETFKNPYTGETITARKPGLVKINRLHGLKSVERSLKDDMNKQDQGETFRYGDIGPARVIGDDIWLNADSGYRYERPNTYNRLIAVNDWSTYHGSMREVTDPTLMSANATHTFNDLNAFNSAWSGMDGLKVWSVSRGYGRKRYKAEDMPDDWKQFVADTHPELLSNAPSFAD